MKLAQLLGYIVPNVLLTLMFFTVLFPVAILSQLFRRKDPLMLKNKKSSTFREIDRCFRKQDFEKMW